MYHLLFCYITDFRRFRKDNNCIHCDFTMLYLGHGWHRRRHTSAHDIGQRLNNRCYTRRGCGLGSRGGRLSRRRICKRRLLNSRCLRKGRRLCRLLVGLGNNLMSLHGLCLSLCLCLSLRLSGQLRLLLRHHGLSPHCGRPRWWRRAPWRPTVRVPRHFWLWKN